MIRLGVTGTDTGVGKTVVTCALGAALRARALNVVAMKPIETGVSPNDPSRDGARIARAAGNSKPLSQTAPVTLTRPVAPLIAAREDGVIIDLAALDEIIANASNGADVLIVEGAGGLLVPVTPTESFAELFRRWSLDVVVVAANRLGVLNHTMLTLRTAATSGLTVRAVVLTQLTSAAADESASGNLASLRELIPSIPVVALPWTRNVDDLQGLAELAEDCGVVDLVLLSAAPSFVRRKR
ncbi:MAG: dethiobiotin synthase [Gemmatimonadaceae bacterium]